MTERVLGYAEGFYGRLLSWDERRMLVDALASNGQNTYYYAPKEDALHRLHWRSAYSETWLEEFSSFCMYANQHGVKVVAGVAPGLDFDFKDLPDGTDFLALSSKSASLLSAGANELSLLMDDIDEDFEYRSGQFSSEGQAHATLANSLAAHVGTAVWVTPRIYADELIVSDTTYLPDFLETLSELHTVLYCGSDVVAKHASTESLHDGAKAGRQAESQIQAQAMLKARPTILWDNLYANDYCPRRLFVGPWQGRAGAHSVLLNPTGMVHTDTLLLDLMAAHIGKADNSIVAKDSWQSVLIKHGVPSSFFELAPYLYHPVFNGHNEPTPPIATSATFEAIEHCLWRWKTPLAREWYSYIFGLKHDLLIQQNQLPDDRVRKTQTSPLAQTLNARGI